MFLSGHGYIRRKLFWMYMLDVNPLPFSHNILKFVLLTLCFIWKSVNIITVYLLYFGNLLSTSSRSLMEGFWLWQIEGDVAGVKKALIAISFCLQDFVQSEKAKISGTRNPETMVHQTSSDFHVDPLPQRNTALSATPSNSIGFAPGTYSSPVDVDSVSSTEAKAIYQEVSYRILCSNDRVGGVIGKGGAIVKALQNESGALISVGPSLSDCDDRLITITASEVLLSSLVSFIFCMFTASNDTKLAGGFPLFAECRITIFTCSKSCHSCFCKIY